MVSAETNGQGGDVKDRDVAKVIRVAYLLNALYLFPAVQVLFVVGYLWIINGTTVAEISEFQAIGILYVMYLPTSLFMVMFNFYAVAKAWEGYRKRHTAALLSLLILDLAAFILLQ